jgi:hypothetical protein
LEGDSWLLFSRLQKLVVLDFLENGTVQKNIARLSKVTTQVVMDCFSFLM